MRITVIGASAGIGLEVVKRALQRNHHVTTLSRSKSNLTQWPGVDRILGSATHKKDLRKSILNAEAVIVTLGTGKSRKPTTLYSDFALLLSEIHKEMQFKIPVIIVSGFGAGESWNYNNFLMKLLFNFLLKDVYADKSAMEEIIAASDMRWVMVRPGRLTDGPLTEKYRMEADLFKGMSIGSIGRADVADFLVKQAENPTALHQYPALSDH